MFDQIKMYAGLAIAFVVAIFIGIFQYRGAKIDDLKEDLEEAEEDAFVQAVVTHNKLKKADFEANGRIAAAKAEARDYENITEDFYSI